MKIILALVFALTLAAVGCARPYQPTVTGSAGVGFTAGGGMGYMVPGSTGVISPYGRSIYAGTSADPSTAYAVAGNDQARLAARSSSYAVAAVPVPSIIGGACVGTSCPLPPEAITADSGSGDSDLVVGLVDQTLANTEAIEEIREEIREHHDD